jgi:pyrimidine operon attenuation protein / uracil phosphoribosyltransferase
MSPEDVELMDRMTIQRVVRRMAHEIVEINKGAGELRLVGLQTRGVPLAKRLAAEIKAIENVDVPVGILDVTLYRDDLAHMEHQPQIRKTDVPFDITEKRIVLVDEVVYTGRTIRSALDALMDLGRPRVVQLAVLIDRGHRELPIRPDFVGKDLATGRYEWVRVKLQEVDGEDSVVLEKNPEEGSE